jgi:MoaA/NifB/PqqE/SkfB family radical SAM enzyme
MIRRRHLAMAARFVAHRFRDLHPFEVQAVLLNACNLRCAYCKCPDVRTPVMDTEQRRDVIRHLARLGTIRIKFQGGEPTLRHDFRDLCAESRRCGMITAVTTNGLEIPRRPELLDSLNEIVFSLDSVTPEIHDRARGRGTHARVLEAIEVARGRDLRIFVNMVVTRESLNEIEPMLDFCEARGIGLHAQPVVFGRMYYDEEARPLALEAEEIRVMHRRLGEWKHQGRSLMFAASTYAHVVEWPDYDRLTMRSPAPSACMAGKFYVQIEANGDIVPCAHYDAEFTPKNIVRDGLEAALRHVRHHDCGDCFAAYLNERKALFALRPAALLEVARRG